MPVVSYYYMVSKSPATVNNMPSMIVKDHGISGTTNFGNLEIAFSFYLNVGTENEATSQETL